MTTDTRPLLIGMNNPLSSHPEGALYPRPPGCTGHRIFLMLRSQIPEITEKQYLARFDRRNVLTGVWNLQRARAAAADIWPHMMGRRFALLGKDVTRAFGLHRGERDAPPLMWQELGYRDTHWALLPHPSGRNMWYNTPGNRDRAAQFLAELYRGT